MGPASSGGSTEGHFGTVLPGDLGDLIVVGGYDDPIDVATLRRLMERVGNQGQRSELLDVQVGDFVVSSAGRDDGNDPKRVFHRFKSSPR